MRCNDETTTSGTLRLFLFADLSYHGCYGRRLNQLNSCMHSICTSDFVTTIRIDAVYIVVVVSSGTFVGVYSDNVISNSIATEPLLDSKETVLPFHPIKQCLVLIIDQSDKPPIVDYVVVSKKNSEIRTTLAQLMPSKHRDKARRNAQDREREIRKQVSIVCERSLGSADAIAVVVRCVSFPVQSV